MCSADLAHPGGVVLRHPYLLEAIHHHGLPLDPLVVFLHQQMAETNALELQLLPLVHGSRVSVGRYLVLEREREGKIHVWRDRNRPNVHT